MAETKPEEQCETLEEEIAVTNEILNNMDVIRTIMNNYDIIFDQSELGIPDEREQMIVVISLIRHLKAFNKEIKSEICKALENHSEFQRTKTWLNSIAKSSNEVQPGMSWTVNFKVSDYNRCFFFKITKQHLCIYDRTT